MEIFEDFYASKLYCHCHRYNDICSPILFHSGYEFFYVFSGEVTLEIGSSEKKITAGNAAVLLPDTVHVYRTNGKSESFICEFSDEYIEDIGKKHRLFEHPEPVFSLLHGDEIVNSLETSTNAVLVRGIFICLVSFVLKKENYDIKSRTGIIQNVLDYIEKNYANEISLSDMAAELHYNYNYLSAQINKEFGMSFSKLLNRYRIYTAEKLLKQGTVSITQVSEQCGYSSLRSFNRNFRKINGTTPSNYIDKA